jgi:hypothetical protein
MAGALTAVTMVALALGSVVRPNLKRPPVTVVSVKGPIDGFAMDADRFAYVGYTGGTEGCPTVRLGSFGTRKEVRLAAEVPHGGDTCYLNDLLIALTGTRTVWSGSEDCCHDEVGLVYTVAPKAAPAQIDTYDQTLGVKLVTGVVGGGSVPVYSTVTLEDREHCLDAFYLSAAKLCRFNVQGGRVMRVDQGRAVQVSHAPPAALIASSGDLIALVPASRSTVTCRANLLSSCPEFKPSSRFEIRTMSGGTRISRRGLIGNPTALALTDRFVAILVSGAGGKRLERYETRTGALLGRSAVPAATANELAASDAEIVYRVKKTIYVFDTNNGSTTVAAEAKGSPIGLSAGGHRVAWAETVGGRGEVESLRLPS